MTNEKRPSWVNLMMKYFCVIIPEEEFNEAPCVTDCEEEVISPKVIYVTSATPCDQCPTENAIKKNAAEITGGGIGTCREAPNLQLHKNYSQNTDNSFGTHNSPGRTKDNLFYFVLTISFYLIGLICFTFSVLSQNFRISVILILIGSVFSGLASVIVFHVKRIKARTKRVYTISSGKIYPSAFINSQTKHRYSPVLTEVL